MVGGGCGNAASLRHASSLAHQQLEQPSSVGTARESKPSKPVVNDEHGESVPTESPDHIGRLSLLPVECNFCSKEKKLNCLLVFTD